MFIHASDPERIKKELQQLSYQLADLVKQVDHLSRNIVTTSPRAKQTLPAMFVQEVHRQMSLGIPEDIAVDDARDALDMTKKAAFFYWARAKSHKKGLERYAKIYCYKVLYKRGFSFSKIAETLSLSDTTVGRYIEQELEK